MRASDQGHLHKTDYRRMDAHNILPAYELPHYHHWVPECEPNRMPMKQTST